MGGRRPGLEGYSSLAYIQTHCCAFSPFETGFKKLKIKTNWRNLTLFAPWYGSNNTFIDWIWALTVNCKTSDLSLSSQYRKKEREAHKGEAWELVLEPKLPDQGASRSSFSTDSPSFCTRAPHPREPFRSGRTEMVCHPILDSWVSNFFFFPYHILTASFFIPINKNILWASGLHKFMWQWGGQGPNDSYLSR